MYPSIIKVKTCVILVQFKKLKEIKKERRGRDSNPGYGLTRTTV